MTICFIDNDVILQLAAYNLFREAIDALSLELADLRILSTARYFFKGKKAARQHEPATIQQAIEIAESYDEAVCDQKSPEYKLLIESNGIDLGEATLITATIAVPAFWLATSDKRCLETLATEPKLTSIHQHLVGRVICLEQILLKLIGICEFSDVRQQVRSTLGCAEAIKNCFGRSLPADENSTRDGLNSYIEDLRKKSRGLLVPDIPT